MVRVETTEQLRTEVLAAAGSADAVVMAAAPADFRPTSVSDAKIKKADDGSAPPLELTQNPDILHELSTTRPRAGRGDRRLRRRDRRRDGHGPRAGPGQAGPQGLRPPRRQRRQRGRVFGSAENEAVVLGADGSATEVPRGSKTALAHVIWDEVVARLHD